jgi:hypothetical protein
MLTTRGLARLLGLSPGRGGQLAKQGCPLDNEENALAWYVTHVKPARRPASSPPDKSDVQSRNAPPGTNTISGAISNTGNGSAEHLADSLNRMRILERRLVTEIEESLVKREYSNFVLLRREHVATIKALFAAESQYLTILKTRGKLITIEAHLSLSSEVLASLSVLVRGLPGMATTPEERRVLEKVVEQLNAGVRELIERHGA